MDDKLINEIDESTAIIPITNNQSLDAAVDKSLLELPLDKEEQELITQIIQAPTKADLQEQFELFNINQTKKNALRIVKLNNLLGKVENQAIERFEKRPDQVSNKELLEYMSVVSGQIDRAQKSIDALSQDSIMHVSHQTNQLNINVVPELDRDSKERVVDAISALLKQVKQKPQADPEAPIIDAKFENISEDSAVADTEIESNDSNLEITFNTED